MMKKPAPASQEAASSDSIPQDSSKLETNSSNITSPPQVPNATQPVNHRPPLILIVILLGLTAIFAFGLKWILSLGSGDVGSVPFLVFDYTVGLTMIFLPCTLPLAFVIVPMVMGKSYHKGIGMVLAFGLGVTITLSIYGALIGLLGQVLGINQIETAKNILYAIAGAMAIAFALGELGLIRFRAPTYGGGVPSFILKQKDLVKAGLLGLFLGNVGVGCPNPLFNAVIVPQIVATGSPFQGWVIMVVQALGRITPLFILALLAIMGINATSFLVKHKDKVAQFTAWTTIFVGGFLLSLGLFGHDWWVVSGIHTLGEKLTQENFITNLLGSKVDQFGHAHGIPTGTGLFGLPLSWGTAVLLIIWIIPLVWYLFYREEQVKNLSPEQQPNARRYLKLLGWFFVVITAFLVTMFGYLLPHMFMAHWSLEHSDMGHSIKAILSSNSGVFRANIPFTLTIVLQDANGKPLSGFEVSHERILHVILVSEDLEEFIHVHPEDFGAVNEVNLERGEFAIPLTLTKAGKYRVLLDTKHKGAEVSTTEWLTVEGRELPISIEKNLARDKLFDGYRVVLNAAPRQIKSGEQTHLSYYIESNGRQILDTEPYLGADMHLLIAPVDLSSMLHTHGLKPKSGKNTENPLGEIDAHYVFPFPGLWKIYGQFQHMGKVITVEFMVEVGPGETSSRMPSSHGADGQMH